MSLVEFITFNSESRLFKKICRSVRLSVQLSFVCFDGPNLSFKLRFYQKQEWQHDFVVYVLVVFYFVLFFYFYFLLKPKAGFSISFQNLEFDNFGRCCDFDWCVYLLANDELNRRLPEEGRKKRLRDGSNQHQQVDHDKNKRRKFHKISFQKNNFKQKKFNRHLMIFLRFSLMKSNFLPLWYATLSQSEADFLKEPNNEECWLAVHGWKWNW